MSKSKGNVVTPDSVVERHGADALRVYELFIAPFEQSVAWSDRGVQGCFRFLSRFWNLVCEVVEAQGSGVSGDDAEAERGRQLLRTLHKTIRKVTHDMEHFRFNTAVSALMELQNEALDVSTNARGALTLAQWREIVADMTLLLAPMAPHLGEEVWEFLEQGATVLDAPWPGWDAELAADEVVTVVVQVNGKLRDRLQVAVDAVQEDVLAEAKAAANTVRFLEGKQIVKEILRARQAGQLRREVEGPGGGDRRRARHGGRPRPPPMPGVSPRPPSAVLDSIVIRCNRPCGAMRTSASAGSLGAAGRPTVGRHGMPIRTRRRSPCDCLVVTSTLTLRSPSWSRLWACATCS